MFPPEIWGCIGLYCDIKTLHMLSYVTESSGEACRLLKLMHSKLIKLHKQYADMTSVDATVPHPYCDFQIGVSIRKQPIETLIKEWSTLKNGHFSMKYFAGFIYKIWPKLRLMDMYSTITPNYAQEKLQLIVEKDNSDITMNMGCLIFDDDSLLILYQPDDTLESKIASDIKKMIMAFIQLFCDGFNLPFVCEK